VFSLAHTNVCCKSSEITNTTLHRTVNYFSVPKTVSSKSHWSYEICICHALLLCMIIFFFFFFFAEDNIKFQLPLK
jgi:hypothetical protein